jgi:hypothetical protein
MAAFCVVAPCRLAEVYRRFKGACCLHRHSDEYSWHLWNVNFYQTTRRNNPQDSRLYTRLENIKSHSVQSETRGAGKYIRRRHLERYRIIDPMLKSASWEVYRSLVRKYTSFMEAKCSLSCSLQSATGPYPKPVVSTPHPHILFLQDSFF